MTLIEEGFLERNKKIILISLIIFLVSACGGAIYSNMTIGDQYGLITEKFSNTNMTFGNEDIGLTTDGLFIHNLTANLIQILGGLLFSVISLIVFVYNAISIGSMFGADFTFACLSILPHGIIEYSASVLAFAIALLITKLEIKMIKNRSIRGTLDENRVILKDILVLFIAVVVMLLVAAFIEANITTQVISYYFGL